MKKMMLLGLFATAAVHASDQQVQLVAPNDGNGWFRSTQAAQPIAPAATVSVNVYDPATGEHRLLTLHLDSVQDDLYDY